MYTNAFNNDVFNPTHITSKSEVEQFANCLINVLNINVHPETLFKGYIEVETKVSAFTPEDAAIGNRLMDECFNLCDKDEDEIYETMCKYLFERLETGVN